MKSENADKMGRSGNKRSILVSPHHSEASAAESEVGIHKTALASGTLIHHRSMAITLRMRY